MGEVLVWKRQLEVIQQAEKAEPKDENPSISLTVS
jgi:hypothetical protein